MEARMNGVCLSVVLMLCLIGCLAQGLSAPKWKPKSRPANGDSIIAKTDGSQVKLNCAVKGKPKPSIAWYKDGQLFDHTQRKKTKLHRYSLTLNDVTVSDKGNYMCVVRNTEGQLNFTFLVDVIHTSWPLELEEPQNKTVLEGGRVEFRCRALNDPDATTKWLKRKEGQYGNLAPTSDFLPTPDNQGTLIIDNVTVNDAGQYTCLVGNYVGIKSVDAFLTVIPKTTTTTTTSTTTTTPTTTTTTPTTTTTTPTTTTTTPTTTTTTRRTTTTTTVATTTTLLPLPDFPDSFGKDMEKKKKKNKNKKKNKKKDKKKNKNKKNRKDKERERAERRRQRQREREMRQREKEMKRQEMEKTKDFEYPFDTGIIPPRETTTPYDQYYPRLDNRDPKKPNVTLTHIPRIPHQDLEIGEGVGENKKPVKGKSEEDMSVSVWTIYIIVGSVAGGVLLVGLVAIVVALCCNRIEENNGYKHTSV